MPAADILSEDIKALKQLYDDGILTKEEYEKQFHSTNRPPSYTGIKWWEEDKEITDSELKV